MEMGDSLATVGADVGHQPPATGKLVTFGHLSSELDQIGQDPRIIEVSQ
jgi:hypothetical protein